MRRLTATGWLWLSYVVILVALFVWLSSPVTQHNERGGYIPACGELPGVLGDDC